MNIPKRQGNSMWRGWAMLDALAPDPHCPDCGRPLTEREHLMAMRWLSTPPPWPCPDCACDRIATKEDE